MDCDVLTSCPSRRQTVSSTNYNTTIALFSLKDETGRQPPRWLLAHSDYVQIASKNSTLHTELLFGPRGVFALVALIGSMPKTVFR